MTKTTSAQYFDAIDDLAGGEGRYYRITDEGESPYVAVAVYDGVPEDGHTTAFSFGLSSATHPEWKHSRPELILSVKSMDHAWGLCMGEIIRNYGPESLFSYGTVLHFRQSIADDSSMTSFLIFSNSLLDAGDERLELPDRTIHLSQLYPIHEAEAELVEQLGAERFFLDLDIDFFDVKRPPAQAR